MGATKEPGHTILSASTRDESQTSHDYYQDDAEKQPVHDNDGSNAAVNEISPKDPNVVDWDGLYDPDNPFNWPSTKKVTTIGIVSLITLLLYVMPSMARLTLTDNEQPYSIHNNLACHRRCYGNI